MSVNNQPQEPTKDHFEHEIYLLNEEFYTTQMTKDEYLKRLFPLQRAMYRAPDKPVIRQGFK
jgi:truncated hemoglobin YjbI